MALSAAQPNPGLRGLLFPYTVWLEGPRLHLLGLAPHHSGDWYTALLIHLLLLLLLSRFSRVQLCATPQTAAHQALPPLGFSRQGHWSGLPLPSHPSRLLLNPGIWPDAQASWAGLCFNLLWPILDPWHRGCNSLTALPLLFLPCSPHLKLHGCPSGFQNTVLASARFISTFEGSQASPVARW